MRWPRKEAVRHTADHAEAAALHQCTEIASHPMRVPTHQAVPAHPSAKSSLPIQPAVAAQDLAPHAQLTGEERDARRGRGRHPSQHPSAVDASSSVQTQPSVSHTMQPGADVDVAPSRRVPLTAAHPVEEHAEVTHTSIEPSESMPSV